jgi:hypothetical protein
LKKRRNYLGDVGVYGRIILKWILKRWGLEWIQLAQNKVQWWDFVNAVMHLRVL